MVASDAELPTFSADQTADRLEFFVLIRWPNGAEARINHFGNWQDAQGWILRESANWLRIRSQTGPQAQSKEGENPIVPRAARARILRAA
jgi:hypothetical protein